MLIIDIQDFMLYFDMIFVKNMQLVLKKNVKQSMSLQQHHHLCIQQQNHQNETTNTGNTGTTTAGQDQNQGKKRRSFAFGRASSIRSNGSTADGSFDIMHSPTIGIGAEPTMSKNSKEEKDDSRFIKL